MKMLVILIFGLLVLGACGEIQWRTKETPTPTAAPEPISTPVFATATPIPLSETNDLPLAVQILSEEYQEAYRLLPDGEWAQKLYLSTTFDDFDPERFENASDQEPTNTVIPITPFGAGDEFNLKRVLKMDREWVEAKVKELAPNYSVRFDIALDADTRYAVLDEAVMAGDVRSEVLVAEIYFRWQALLSDMTDEQADLEIATTLQMMGRSDLWYTVSEKGMIIRLNELRVCQLLMSEIVGVPHTLDVEENNKCNLEKVVELANGALLSGKVPPTEDEYKAWFEEHERLLSK